MEHTDVQSLKDAIQYWLLTTVSEQNRTVVLLIDEGQKIRDDCLEILRELLNFETNTDKLLQIVLFAQTELRPRLQAVPNLIDRINFSCELGPLSLGQTRDMIEFRMAKNRHPQGPALHLTWPALYSIYRATKGYPRQIIHLCHQVVLTMSAEQTWTMNRTLIRRCIHKTPHPRIVSKKQRLTPLAALSLLILCIPFLLLASMPTLPHSISSLHSGLFLAMHSGKEPPAHKTAPAEGSSSHIRKDIQWPVQEKPEILGTLGLRPKDSVWELSQIIYNTQDQKVLNRIVLPAARGCNPDLKDLNQLSIHTPVSLPVIPRLASVAPSQCFLSIHHSSELAQSYAWFVQHQGTLPGTGQNFQFIALWDPARGLQFHILEQTSYDHPSQAQAALQNLSQSLRPQAKVLDWTGDSVQPLLLSVLGGKNEQ